MSKTREWTRILAGTVLAVASSGCRWGDMFDMPRPKAYKETPVFADATMMRLPPSGTASYGSQDVSEALTTGTENGRLVTKLPMPLTGQILQRGRGRFSIYCEPCHGALGRGDGPVERRGFFPRPVADLQEPRLRGVADGYLFGVISNGYYTMPAYGDVLAPPDRWAVVAYVRALQLSQNAPADIVPAQERARAAKGSP